MNGSNRTLAGVLLVSFALAGPACGLSSSDSHSASAAGREVTIAPDVVYGHKYGLALTFDVYRPARPNGAGVLFLNSGGFVSGQIVQHAPGPGGAPRFLEPGELTLAGGSEVIPLLDQFSFRPLLDAGFTVFDVRHGGSPRFTLPEIVEDVTRAARYITLHASDFGVSAERLGVWGPSAGGFLALHLGLRGDPGIPDAPDPIDRTPFRLRAVGVYYPAGWDFVDDSDRFPEVLASIPALQVERGVLDSLSLRHRVGRDAAPTVIVVGAEDFPFITGPSESVHVALTRLGVPCRLVTIPGTGHEFRGEDGYQPENAAWATRELVAWFEDHLAPR